MAEGMDEFIPRRTGSDLYDDGDGDGSNGAIKARVSNSPAAVGDDLYVVRPGFSAELADGPCRWSPIIEASEDGTQQWIRLPRRGDPALLFEVEGEFVVAEWGEGVGEPTDGIPLQGGGSAKIDNLYVQEVRPTNPYPNGSLWVPLNPDGTPKLANGNWEVFTNGNPSAGPTRLYVQEVQPSNPEPGSVWVPLNPDGTPKKIWQVFS